MALLQARPEPNSEEVVVVGFCKDLCLQAIDSGFCVTQLCVISMPRLA